MKKPERLLSGLCVLDALTASLPGAAGLEEFGGDWVFVDRVVAGDDGEAGGGNKVVLLVFLGVVADDSSVRNVDVAVDDGVPNAAVAADVNVREDDAGVDVGVGVDADV